MKKILLAILTLFCASVNAVLTHAQAQRTELIIKQCHDDIAANNQVLSLRGLLVCSKVAFYDNHLSVLDHQHRAFYVEKTLNTVCPSPVALNLNRLAMYISCTDNEVANRFINFPRREEFSSFATSNWHRKLKLLFEGVDLRGSRQIATALGSINSPALQNAKARMYARIQEILEMKTRQELKRVLMRIYADLPSNQNWPPLLNENAVNIRKQYFTEQTQDLVDQGLLSDEDVQAFIDEYIVLQNIPVRILPPVEDREPPVFGNGRQVDNEPVTVGGIFTGIYKQAYENLRQVYPRPLMATAYATANRNLLNEFTEHMVSTVESQGELSDGVKFELLQKIDAWKTYAYAQVNHYAQHQQNAQQQQPQQQHEDEDNVVMESSEEISDEESEDDDMEMSESVTDGDPDYDSVGDSDETDDLLTNDLDDE